MANEKAGGVGTLTVILIVFVILKLTDNIDWSWWWVLSPMWMPLGLAAVIFVVFVGPLALIAAISERRARNNRLRNWEE